MTDKQATETEQDWARRIGLAGQSEQSEESVRQIARVIGTYYHALIAADVPKRMAMELTFAYQHMLFQVTLASLGLGTEQA